MRARLIKEYSQNFIRGKKSKEALNVGLYKDIFNERAKILPGIPGNFWSLYPEEEYVRLMKEYFSEEKVMKFLTDHNIDEILKDITYNAGTYKTEIVSFNFYSKGSLEGLGKLFLAMPVDQGASWKSQIGTERNRMFGRAGQEWDEFYIRPNLQSMFYHPMRD